MASASDLAAAELQRLQRERMSLYASFEARANRMQRAISTDDRSQRQFLYKVREAELQASRDMARSNARKYELLDQARAKRAAYSAAVNGQPFDPDTMDPMGYDMGAKAIGRGEDRAARGAIAAARDADRDADRALRADRDSDLRGYRASRLSDADLDRDLRARGLDALKDYRDTLSEDRDLDRGARDAKAAASAAAKAARDSRDEILDKMRRIEAAISERRKLYYKDGALDQNALFGDAQYQRLNKIRADLMNALLGDVDGSEAPPPPAGGGLPAATGGTGNQPIGVPGTVGYPQEPAPIPPAARTRIGNEPLIDNDVLIAKDQALAKYQAGAFGPVGSEEAKAGARAEAKRLYDLYKAKSPR